MEKKHQVKVIFFAVTLEMMIISEVGAGEDGGKSMPNTTTYFPQIWRKKFTKFDR